MASKKMTKTELATKMMTGHYAERTCKSTHECAFCVSDITLDQQYFDGGYGRRAHTLCAEAVLLEAQENGE